MALLLLAAAGCAVTPPAGGAPVSQQALGENARGPTAFYNYAVFRAI